MPRKHPQPFWRESRQCWFVQLGKKQIRLDPDEQTAFRLYHELMSRPPEVRTASTPPGTVLGLLDAYLEWAEHNRAPRTYDWLKMHLQTFADSIPPSLAVDQVRPWHVTTCMDAREGWSANTKNGFARAVQQAFRWAMRQGLIASNPLQFVEKPSAEARELYVTPEDYDRIIASVKSRQLRDLIAFAWETGARAQEIRVIEAKHCEPGRIVLPPSLAKGKKRIRVIYLTETAADIVRQLAEKHPSGPVFRNSAGNPWTKDAINCAFERLKGKLGVKYHLGAFRKGFTTRALKNGVDTVTVAGLLGHSNAVMVSRVYGRVQADPEFMAKAAQKARGG